MPWDDSTVLGYSLTMINTLIGSWTTCIVIVTVNSLFFGICFYIVTMLSEMFSMFDQIDKHFEKNKKSKMATDAVYIGDQLKKMIEFHITILE